MVTGAKKGVDHRRLTDLSRQKMGSAEGNRPPASAAEGLGIGKNGEKLAERTSAAPMTPARW